jgi:hypothetical protein
MSRDRFKEVADFLGLKLEDLPLNVKLARRWELMRAEAEEKASDERKPEVDDVAPTRTSTTLSPIVWKGKQSDLVQFLSKGVEAEDIGMLRQICDHFVLPDKETGRLRRPKVATLRGLLQQRKENS